MQQRILWKKQETAEVMLMEKILLVSGMMICLNGCVLQVTAYSTDNEPLFVLGTVYVVLGGIFAAIDLVKRLREFFGRSRNSARAAIKTT